ncbi:hypothetical protein AL073_04425 [Loktanella sp. 1ANDIMAR09]|nr:hypothetical protein AL073_04425 [Loktanella sp. 1ANDIMAR09]
MKVDFNKHISFARNLVALIDELRLLATKNQRRSKKLEDALMICVKDSYTDFVNVSDEYYSVVSEISRRLSEALIPVDTSNEELRTLLLDFVKMRSGVALKRIDLLEGSWGMARALEGNLYGSNHFYSFHLFAEMVEAMHRFFVQHPGSALTYVLEEIETYMSDHTVLQNDVYLKITDVMRRMEMERGRVSLLHNQILAHIATK